MMLKNRQVSKKRPLIIRGLFLTILVREGFEPSKASPKDLQSFPFGHSGTSPKFKSWREDLNPQQADYKSAALPIELRQLDNGSIDNFI